MDRPNEEESYRVLLKGIREDSEEKRESFCRLVSKRYGIPYSFLKRILDKCPIVLKKNLPFRKAAALTKVLIQYGALVSIEERRDASPIFLEFQELYPHRVALESSRIWRTSKGTWNITGRMRNISRENLNNTWVLVQFFENSGTLTTFEEVPLSINPLPPGEASPFRVLFEGDFPIHQVSVAFKSGGGFPIPAEDRRKKEVWAEINIPDEGEQRPSAPPSPPEGKAPAVDATSLVVRDSVETKPLPMESPGDTLEPEVIPFSPVQEDRGETPDEAVLEESLAFSLEETPLEDEIKTPREIETPPQSTSAPVIEKEIPRLVSDEEATTRPMVSDAEAPPRPMEPERTLSGKDEDASNLDASVLREATQLLDRIARTPGAGDEGERLSPWMEKLRSSIQSYSQYENQPFVTWFRTCTEEHRFENDLHSLLIILTHARFDQGTDPEKSLGNTQKVVQYLVQQNPSLQEIPPLEKTKYFSAEQWRTLFHKAIPRIQQIGREILTKGKWDGQELERMIQVIPHMSSKTSRRAVRWIHGLIPKVVEIDFSTTPVLIGEDLYRVACRLGVTDPNFDYVHNPDSVGYEKIQRFAKEAFPQDPVKIEEPMTEVGMNGGRMGHCFSVRPRCEGCLFETFCPKLYLQMDPAKKGMREDA